MNNLKRISLSIILSLGLLLISFLDYYWQQVSEYAPPVMLTLELILGLLVLGQFLYTGFRVYEHRTEWSVKLVTPTTIYLVAIILMYTGPDFLNARYYQSKVKYRGCYEGTTNTGTILFRESGKFEYSHVGFFGITTFRAGVWRQRGDTLYIDFKDEIPEFVGVKLLMTKEGFIKVQGDSLLASTIGFYQGYCLGLN